jgi:hypothetical protein
MPRLAMPVASAAAGCLLGRQAPQFGDLRADHVVHLVAAAGCPFCLEGCAGALEPVSDCDGETAVVTAVLRRLPTSQRLDCLGCYPIRLAARSRDRAWRGSSGC